MQKEINNEGNHQQQKFNRRQIHTFQFIRTARRVLAKTPMVRKLLMFWRKERTKESNRGLPSTLGSRNLSFSLMVSKSWGENTDTSALRTGANPSYAARQISAPVCFGAYNLSPIINVLNLYNINLNKL